MNTRQPWTLLAFGLAAAMFMSVGCEDKQAPPKEKPPAVIGVPPEADEKPAAEPPKQDDTKKTPVLDDRLMLPPEDQDEPMIVPDFQTPRSAQNLQR